jgi:hypothetical protein
LTLTQFGVIVTIHDKEIEMKFAAKIAVVAALTMSSVTSAHAWGPREQGIVTGIAGVLLYQHITQPRVYVQPHGHYVQPPVQYAREQVFVVPPVQYFPPPPPRAVYRTIEIYIPECNCYRNITVQVN